MANVQTIQIITDGPRNVTVKVEGILDTSDVVSASIVDPAALSAIIDSTKASKLRIDKITHNIEDGLAVILTWFATTPVRIESLTGRGNAKYKDFGGLINNAGAGVNGKIYLSTEGYTATSLVVSYSIILEMVKTQ